MCPASKTKTNTHMKTYLKSQMNLSSNPGLLVTTCIGGSILSITLGELPVYLKSKGLSDNRPMGTMVEGLKNGIFPVLTPKSLAASLALKVKGYDCPVGDGVSLLSQKAANTIAKEIRELGVSLDELAFEWMVGVPQGATAVQLESAKSPEPKRLRGSKPPKAVESTEEAAKQIFG